jgi:predicted nucleic acid-binding protein
MVAWLLSSGVKIHRREADTETHIVPRLKIVKLYPTTPYTIMAWKLVNITLYNVGAVE